MDLFECLKMFLSWPEEVQQACLFQLRCELSQVKSKQVSVPAKSRPTRPPKKNKRWSTGDRMTVFAHFDEHGWDQQSAMRLARILGRSVSAIRGQYDHDYQDWVKSGRKN
jgi:hypothetical protein